MPRQYLLQLCFVQSFNAFYREITFQGDKFKSMTLSALSPVQPASFSSTPRQIAKVGLRVVSPLAAYEIHRSSSEPLNSSTPAYMTGMTPDDLVNPTYSPLQRWALRSIAWYQRTFRKVDDSGHVHNTHGLCCRFHPSCSTYTAQAIKELGFLQGTYKGFVRTAIKCNPIQPLIQEYGFFPALMITVKSIVSELGAKKGFNFFPTERAQVMAVLNRMAQGEKIVDPVKK